MSSARAAPAESPLSSLRFVTALAVLLTSAPLAGCTDRLPFGNSGDDEYLEVGRTLIEGELAERIALGPLAATCDGRDLGPGDTFRCAAKADGRDPIEFIATIDGTGQEIDIATTNLLLADQVEQVETFAASLIEQSTGQPFGPENFECADSSLVVRVGDVIDCLATDPDEGTVFHAPVMIDDLENLSVTVTVGEPIQ